jgi:hypothetical protein
MERTYSKSHSPNSFIFYDDIEWNSQTEPIIIQQDDNDVLFTGVPQGLPRDLTPPSMPPIQTIPHGIRKKSKQELTDSSKPLLDQQNEAIPLGLAPRPQRSPPSTQNFLQFNTDPNEPQGFLAFLYADVRSSNKSENEDPFEEKMMHELDKTGGPVRRNSILKKILPSQRSSKSCDLHGHNVPIKRSPTLESDGDKKSVLIPLHLHNSKSDSPPEHTPTTKSSPSPSNLLKNDECPPLSLSLHLPVTHHSSEHKHDKKGYF